MDCRCVKPESAMPWHFAQPVPVSRHAGQAGSASSVRFRRITAAAFSRTGWCGNLEDRCYKRYRLGRNGPFQRARGAMSMTLPASLAAANRFDRYAGAYTRACFRRPCL